MSDDGEDGVDPLGAIHSKASAQTAKWYQNWLRRVRALRAAERKSLYGIASSMQRSAGEITLSFLVKHETFRCAAPHRRPAPSSRTVPHRHAP